ILYIVQHAEARAFIVQEALAERIEPIRDNLDFPSARFVWIGRDGDQQTPPDGWSSYESLIERASVADPSILVRPDDAWAMMYTSGTTGRPKGAVRSHRASALLSLITALEMGFSPSDAALLVMPMFHANSLFFTATFAYLGAACVVDDSASFDPE